MTYELASKNGNIDLAPLSTMNYAGLVLIGRDSTNWNEPIQQNFVTIIDKLDKVEDDVINTIGDFSQFDAEFNINK